MSRIARVGTTCIAFLLTLGIGVAFADNSAPTPSAQPAQPAQTSEPGDYAGVLLGPSFANQSLGTGFVVGGHVGAKLGSVFGLGFYGTYQSLASASASNGSVTTSVGASEVILAAEPNFFLLGDDSLYLGAKVGIGITSVSASANGSTNLSIGASQTNFAVGPALGCNFKVAPNWSVNGEVNAIWVTDSGGSLNLINLLVGASYWF